jgi:hypothetical protein
MENGRFNTFLITDLGRAYVRGANNPFAWNCTAEENPINATPIKHDATPNVNPIDAKVDIRPL